MAISLKELNKCIKNSLPIYHDGYKIIPIKIGSWNKIKLVQVVVKDSNRVVDYEYLIRNFTLDDTSF